MEEGRSMKNIIKTTVGRGVLTPTTIGIKYKSACILNVGVRTPRPTEGDILCK